MNGGSQSGPELCRQDPMSLLPPYERGAVPRLQMGERDQGALVEWGLNSGLQNSFFTPCSCSHSENSSVWGCGPEVALQQSSLFVVRLASVPASDSYILSAKLYWESPWRLLGSDPGPKMARKSQIRPSGGKLSALWLTQRCNLRRFRAIAQSVHLTSERSVTHRPDLENNSEPHLLVFFVLTARQAWLGGASRRQGLLEVL